MGPAMENGAGRIVEEHGQGRQRMMLQAASSRSVVVAGNGGCGRTHPQGAGPGPATEDVADGVVKELGLGP